MEKEKVQRLNNLPGWLSEHEGQFLRRAALMVSRLPGEIVEIGSFQGKSTIWLALSGQTVHAIDPHKGELDDTKYPPTLSAFRKNITGFGVEKNVILKRMTSLDAAAGWDKKIRLLFIDGLHDEKNARDDYLAWSPFVGEKGIVAMHDAFCGWEGAGKVAREKIVAGGGFYEVGVVGSIIYGIRGKTTPLSRLLLVRSRLFIHISEWLHRQKYVPSFVSFFLIHRVMKLFLLNRFTLRRE